MALYKRSRVVSGTRDYLEQIQLVIRARSEFEISRFSPGTTSTECQTDLTIDEIEYLITELEECWKKITILDLKVENKKRLKREINTEDMLRNDESVKFYTGLPMVFASTATISSSCSTQLPCDINFVSSASVTAAAVVCGSN